jgi:hypothetical protein
METGGRRHPAAGKRRKRKEKTQTRALTATKPASRHQHAAPARRRSGDPELKLALNRAAPPVGVGALVRGKPRAATGTLPSPAAPARLEATRRADEELSP